MFSIVIPTTGPVQAVKRSLEAFAKGKNREYEILLVTKETPSQAMEALAERWHARLLPVDGVRGARKNAGIEAATFPWVVIVHPGVLLGAGWLEEVTRFVAEPDNVRKAGLFRFALGEESAGARQYEALMRFAHHFGGSSGGQALLMHRELWEALGRFTPEPLYEDFDLVRRLYRRHRAALVLLKTPSMPETEPYREKGLMGALLKRLTALYFHILGAKPDWLLRHVPPE